MVFQIRNIIIALDMHYQVFFKRSYNYNTNSQVQGNDTYWFITHSTLWLKLKCFIISLILYVYVCVWWTCAYVCRCPCIWGLDNDSRYFPWELSAIGVGSLKPNPWRETLFSIWPEDSSLCLSSVRIIGYNHAQLALKWA